MAEIVEFLDEEQFHSSLDTTNNSAIIPGDGDAVPILEINSSKKMCVPSFELQDKLLPQDSMKLEFSRGVSTAQQQKRELYYKLDTILITALQSEFEVWPGHTVDRQDMVEYLRGIVVQHISEHPELEKILSLRDTVLTGRVKRAFPGVEYKRKQMRQDHYRKAWLYVNIRRKSAPFADPVKGGTMIRSSVSATSTWTPPVVPESMVIRQSPLNSKISAGTDHLFPCPTRTSASPTSSSPDTNTELATPYSVYPDSSDDEVNDTAASENCSFAGERSALVLDNYTIVTWVRSQYVEDSASHVPVQDVVKAFKEAFNYDISYKECHQMIYSTFTNPRNRSSPMKTVRVSSMGQQYIYRGIAHIKHENEETTQGDGTLPAQNTPQHIHDEREEVWKRMVEDLKQERDQGVMERNQALTALLKLEKTHAQALTSIEKFEEDGSAEERSAGPGDQPESTSESAGSVQSSENSSLSHLLRNFGQCCELCAKKEKSYERIKDERDQIWKEIVTQAQHERDGALRRLEIVKQERDRYLERLHALEKENQRLRDEVNAGCSEPRSCRPVADFKLNWSPKTKFTSENGDSKEALNSVLSHLRSKRACRKQAAPSRCNKVPKLHNAEESTDQTAGERKGSDETTPFIVHSGSTPPGSPDELKLATDSPDVDGTEGLSRTGRRNGEESDCNKTNSGKKLIITQGSEMIAFRRHPLDE